MKMPPKTYLFSLLLIAAILLFMALGYVKIIESQEIFWVMSLFITGWFFIIVFAIVGGVLFGMLLGHRILSVSQFTPFEKAMLEMHSEIKSIKEKIDEYDNKEVISKIIAIEQELRSLQEGLPLKKPQEPEKTQDISGEQMIDGQVSQDSMNEVEEKGKNGS